jgi:hypothetical protein
MSYRRGYGCCALSLAWLLTSASARGDESEPPAPQDPLVHNAFQIDDADPESSVPTPEQAMKSPLKMGYYIMLLIERGQKAEERGELDTAIKFYRALAKTAPDRSTGHAELCRAYEKRGDIDAAIESCRVVLGLGGVRVQDHLHFVSLLLKKPSGIAPSRGAVGWIRGLPRKKASPTPSSIMAMPSAMSFTRGLPLK